MPSYGMADPLAASTVEVRARADLDQGQRTKLWGAARAAPKGLAVLLIATPVPAQENRAMSRIRTKNPENGQTKGQSYQKPLRVRHGGDGDDRWYTKLVHPVVRWRLGPRYAGMKDTYVTMASWTLESSDLLNSGRLSLTDLARLLDLSHDTVRTQVDQLCALDAVQKVWQRSIEDLEIWNGHPSAVTVLVKSPPAWMMENVALLEVVWKARTETKRRQAKLALRSQQIRVLKMMRAELRRGVKTKPITAEKLVPVVSAKGPCAEPG